MNRAFILLDDARSQGASDARLYRGPVECVIARRADQVAPALERIEALRRDGFDLAGHIAYEAGYALEPRLKPLLANRIVASGPLLWFGAFKGYETIAPADVPKRLRALADGEGASLGPMEPQLSPGGYAQAFAMLKQAIEAGDIYQANLTFPLQGSWRGDPVALYAAIRPAAAAGYGGIVYDGAHWLLSFSPELFFALKQGAATVKPMKGTRPRGRDLAQDAELARDLALSGKDRAENLMIVDLMRNDLARVAVAGSVRVENAFAVETYPTVHQMTSTIRANLLPGLGACDMLRALFPCGSITGTPKIRAQELIAAAERDARGPYCGAIGRIDATGDAAFNVAIRTMRLTPGEGGRKNIGGQNVGGQAVLGVGSAIVADSACMAEWRECLIKGGFVRQAVSEVSVADFDLIETMAFAPDSGVPLLELHLERLKASAAELGFSFDRHALRNAIQALCFDAERPGKLRLLVARSGSFSLELAPLPPPLPDPAPCAVLYLPVSDNDWRLRHKCTDRSFYESGLAAAQETGACEALFIRDDGLVTEGTFTNLFVERDGRLLTPPARLGLLPGVLRRSLIEAGGAVEAELRLDDLEKGFFIGNAVRGLMPARLYP
ncbi:MAG: aminodeoxychorismate synthase component I [Novosphingobium sp.]